MALQNDVTLDLPILPPAKKDAAGRNAFGSGLDA